jgi:hypothetical protein
MADFDRAEELLEELRSSSFASAQVGLRLLPCWLIAWQGSNVILWLRCVVSYHVGRCTWMATCERGHGRSWFMAGECGRVL